MIGRGFLEALRDKADAVGLHPAAAATVSGYLAEARDAVERGDMAALAHAAGLVEAKLQVEATLP